MKRVRLVVERREKCSKERVKKYDQNRDIKSGD